MMNTQPEALRIADALMDYYQCSDQAHQAAAELRRLHAQHEALLKALKLVAAQDQGCGGNVSEAEAWRAAQHIARAAIAAVKGEENN